ncbi:MerC domain-containing protein [Roseivirga sp. BDSF3-8]|uniref:MerC domain-containing protein n=1 Tax=Roseivirga sp. BDSF3-8 TaxID=3241598 RepID=UPI003532336A
MSKKGITYTLDKIGMCTSVICMVHCLFFLFGFDAVQRMVDSEWIEWTIIAFALLVGVFSVLSGFISHRQHFIPVLFVAGFLLLINASLW